MRCRVLGCLLAGIIWCSAKQASAATNTEVSLGGSHSCARKADSTLWCWGANDKGQLGDGTTTPHSAPTLIAGISDVVEVSARASHTCARRSSGSVSCWGDNTFGQVGDGTVTQRTLPVQIIASGVAQVAVGGYHTCARKIDGTLWCWGWNVLGQVGDGSGLEQRLSPVQVTTLGSSVAEVSAGDYHTCARKTDGTLSCWGYNIIGQLGDGTTNDHATPTAIPFLANAVREISAGGQHNCVRINDGSAWCWGADEYGQIGKGDTISRQNPVEVLLPGTTAALGVGGYHSCIRKPDASILCWGRRDHGQLGDGVIGAAQLTPLQVGISTSTVLELAGGDLHGCTHRADGSLWCEGANAQGQVGDGTTVDRATPVKVLTGLSTVGVQAPALPASAYLLLALAFASLGGGLVSARAGRARLHRFVAKS